MSGSSPSVDQVLRIARAGAWAAKCPLCGRALKCRNSRRVAGIRVRVHGCPVHGDVEVGTVEILVTAEALKALLCEVERARRETKRLKREAERGLSCVA